MWSRVSRRSVLLALASTALPAPELRAAPERRATKLFVIERSKNRNVVRYDLRLDKSGFYDVRRPLDVYWLMLAEDGRRSELSALERKAYGFELMPRATSSELGVRLVAVKDRPLTVRRRGNVYRAELAIQGVPASLETVFVATRETVPVPTVLYVELRGTSLVGGRALSERITG